MYIIKKLKFSGSKGFEERYGSSIYLCKQCMPITIIKTFRTNETIIIDMVLKHHWNELEGQNKANHLIVFFVLDSQ